MLAALNACTTDMPEIQFGRIGEPAQSSDVLGVIAGDEPEAVLAGQKLLTARGNAADAAVAVGLTLAVTLPSRAGVSGGGACIVHDGKSGITEELDFRTEQALVRGLFALHARYGKRPWAETVAPAATLAQFGATVSRALASDLAAHGKVLMGDSAALAAFLGPERRLLAAGEKFEQPTLAAHLAEARRGGAFVTQGSAPRWGEPRRTREGEHEVYALPIHEPNARASGTGFVVTDGFGNAVSCALTLGPVFGTGRMVDGVLVAGDPSSVPLIASIAIDRASRQARAGAAGAEARFTSWTCTPNPQTCTPVADRERGAYALTVVRDTKM